MTQTYVYCFINIIYYYIMHFPQGDAFPTGPYTQRAGQSRNYRSDNIRIDGLAGVALRMTT